MPMTPHPSRLALSRFVDWPRLLTIVKPDTIVRWHRKGFRLLWRWKSSAPGRPPIPAELRQLIATMATANHTWGEERIAAALLVKLGIRVSPRTADWTAQQFRMIIAGDQPYRFVIHDRDTIYSEGVDATLAAKDLTVLKTPVRAPQANAFCERLVGTRRRECLDFVIPLNERHPPACPAKVGRSL